MIEFEWDSHNIKHIVEDYPERENTISEVESIFDDPFVQFRSVNQRSYERRYTALGFSNIGRIRVVVFAFNNGKVRPITCWPANTQTKREYYERVKN